MAIRNILRDSDPALRKNSRVITDFNKRLHILLDDMRETLLEANGLGLAAPQVGVLRRAVIVVDTIGAGSENETETEAATGTGSVTETEEADEERMIELINPEIIAKSGEQTGSEGCLSVPGVYGIVTRPMLVKVKAQDRFGSYFEFWGKDLTARAICHEIDHLNGIVFTSLAQRFLTEEEIEQMKDERNQNTEPETRQTGDR